MDERGQAVVEYVVLLVVFTAIAVVSWDVLRPAVGQFYRDVSDPRAGMNGMRP